MVAGSDKSLWYLKNIEKGLLQSSKFSQVSLCYCPACHFCLSRNWNLPFKYWTYFRTRHIYYAVIKTVPKNVELPAESQITNPFQQQYSLQPLKPKLLLSWIYHRIPLQQLHAFVNHQFLGSLMLHLGILLLGILYTYKDFGKLSAIQNHLRPSK